jgi:PTH1 family peptidyl-tRNA hydrolase
LAASKKISTDRIIVFHDDLDLAPGTLRLSQNRGAGGHNGVRSLIAALGDKNFFRLRLGIGRPPDGIATEDYVLGNFSAAEEALLSPLINATAVAAAENIFLK